ncbi:hypothetical protein DAPPUDRAFT_326639 [Daphnia pulex]|uniref:Uncharacterized protein n=1 Tax=Daphnia pulex TaxID=6669 RepID=E9H8B5_DAPPU|nr:hypothetical protein DAPPUDRAFT_326639 [Daphnia pulex]|eukprot:EFX72055.1 hypothetical protein DAPPUDRAFT_326639 [Daphnia pulex]
MMRDAITFWSSLSEAVRCRFVKIARHRYASLSEAVRCRIVKIAKHKYASYNDLQLQRCKLRDLYWLVVYDHTYGRFLADFLVPEFKKAT